MTDGSERRQAFRINTIARVCLRPIAEDAVDTARLRVLALSVPELIGTRTLDDTRVHDERAQLELLQRIAFSLDRVNRRIADLEQRRGVAGVDRFSEPLQISLSASGMSGPFDLREEPGSLVEVTLDLMDVGLPLIPGVASVVRGGDLPPKTTALRFEELTQDDRERLFRFAIRMQRHSLRRLKEENDT